MKTTPDKETLDVLFIDNFDSFVFNLVDEFERRGCDVEVWRNDIDTKSALNLCDQLKPRRLVVLSPGPGTPEEAGCCMDLVRRAPVELPIFGVCLGHQAIVAACNGTVERAHEIVHGKASAIHHSGEGVLFHGTTCPMTVGRYHSLVANPSTDDFRVVAQLGDMVMAVEHKTRKLVGVQFHPESILTPEGGVLIENVIRWASAAHTEEATCTSI